MSRRESGRGAWTPAKRAFLARVEEVLDGLRDYWPLTLRQVYYQLVAAGDIENRHTAYQKLSRVLVQARLDGHVAWDAIEDRARSVLVSAGWDDAADFVRDQTGDYLAGYRRDLLRAQDHALEVWVEKDALSHVCHRAAFPYCVPVVVARGFSSVSYLHEAAKRIRHNASRGKGTVILYFGDLDPSGYEMLPAMLFTLEQEMGLQGWVTGIRCALTPDQVKEHGLPTNPDALKHTDTRAKKYIERFGNVAVELDALRPDILEDLVRDSIESWLDEGLLETERRAEAAERERLEVLREKVVALIEAENA
ncbi:MAG: hypothetical protein ACREAA_04840 [Candidatus Polarisedimenticolia bacterium]